MSEDTQELETEVSPLAPAEEEDESESGEDGSDESQAETDPSGSQEIDYKAELEAEKQRRKRAEHTIVKLKKSQPKMDDDDEDEDPVDRLWSKIEERLSARELQSQSKEVERHIAANSSNDDEAESIRWHLENSIRPTGDLELDVLNAKILANRKKILSGDKEKAHSQISKITKGITPAFSGVRQTTQPGRKYTAKERKLLERFGKKL